MSKNAKTGSEKKENDMPEISYQQEVKKYGYHISLKELESEEHKNYINELKLRIETLEKKITENNQTISQLYNNEKTIRNLTEKVNDIEKQKQSILEDCKLKEKNFNEEINILKKKYEDQIQQMKTHQDNLNLKIENLVSLEKVNDSQKKQIKDLQDEISSKAKKAEDKLDKIKLKHGIKYSDLKKKMMDHIEDTQKNVEQLNISHMDISTKLALLQNHQLLIEIEYQSQQVEELLKKKEILEKRIFELEREIEIHHEVENVLAEKNKKYLNTLKNIQIDKEAHSLHTINNSNVVEDHTTNVHMANHNISNTINLTYNNIETSSNFKLFNNNMREFQIVSNLERKIHKLEKELEKKKMDYNIIKDNYEILAEKVTNHEKKYVNIFNLFKEGLDRLTNCEDFNNIPEVKLNLQTIKDVDFSSLSSEVRISVLLLFIKYLLPLISSSDVLTNDNKMSNLLQVQVKYQNSKNTGNVNTNEQHLINKYIGSNRSQSIVPGFTKRNILELPRIKRSVDKRFQIPKVASVLI